MLSFAVFVGIQTTHGGDSLLQGNTTIAQGKNGVKHHVCLYVRIESDWETGISIDYPSTSPPPPEPFGNGVPER